jgi:Suppressor of fused protein (SUFU)
MMRILPGHLERFLGTIHRGWVAELDGKPADFQVVECRGGSLPDVVSYATLGLSDHNLHSTVSGRRIYQELVMVTGDTAGREGIPRVLQQLGREAIESKHAYLAGQVVGPRSTLFEGSEMTALLIESPSYWPREFSKVVLEHDRVCIFAWVIPITSSEALYVADHGRSQFEDLLVTQQPNLADFHRQAVVTSTGPDGTLPTASTKS